MRLRPLRLDDEAAALAAQASLRATDDYTFLLYHDPSRPWQEHLEQIERCRQGVDLPPKLVESMFLVADVGGVIVGRASIRFRLNDWLAAYGGHIGYAVLAPHRGRGHAREILRQSLVVARAGGVERCLLTCSDANAASAGVIESCGGVLEDVVPDEDGSPMRRYWID